MASRAFSWQSFVSVTDSNGHEKGCHANPNLHYAVLNCPRAARAVIGNVTLSGRMPEELWVRQMVHAGKSFETAHWLLTHAEWIENAQYPLSLGLAVVPTESRGAFPEIFNTLVSAVAEQR